MRRSALILAACPLLAVCLLLAACLGSGDPNDEFLDTIGSGQAPFLVLDLGSGQTTPRQEAPPIAPGALVLRLVPAHTHQLGSPVSQDGHQDDETLREVEVSGFYIAVHEITRDQWLTVAGSQPWGDEQGSGSLPAGHLSQAMVESACAAHPALGLALPSPDEWEVACRAGSSDPWSWGETSRGGEEHPAITRHAASVPSGPATVGTMPANALGLHDMHGNLWELTNAGEVRGGSWREDAWQARSANRVPVDPQLPHPLHGWRPVWRGQP